MNPSLDHAYVHGMETAYLVGFILSGLAVLVLWRRGSDRLIALLPLFATFAHQAEEYVFSPLLLGVDQHFLNWAWRAGLELSPLGVVVINVIAWLLAASLLVLKPLGRPWLFLNLFVFATLIGNAMFHLGIATADSAYNPGVLTSLFLYVPLYVMAIVYGTRADVHPRYLIALTLYGFIGHFVLIWLLVPFL